MHGEVFIPKLNKFIQANGPGKAEKAETTSYSMVASVLRALSSSETQVPKEGAERALSRLCQFGGITIGTTEPLLRALQPSPQNAADRELCRLIYYLVQLSLGDGYAGTPMPVPRNHNPMMPLPKAVDRFGPELLSLSWADLGNENSRFLRKQGGMRALAALAHASMTSKPDDLTYVGGMLVTLQSLLERIEQLHQDKILLKRPHAPDKKNAVAEFKGQMEMWGLLRLALSAARVALSQGGVAKIADKSFMGIASPDPLCARHAMAIASTLARDPRGAGLYIEQVEPFLRNNLEIAKETGMLYNNQVMHKPTTDITGAPIPPPKVTRQDQSLNLRCAHARMYLARGCASAVQSGFIGGDVKGAGDVFWRSLVLMLVCDPSNLAALECIRAMFGAPAPHAENLKKRPTWMALPGQEQSMEAFTLAKTYGASWHMVVSEADELVPLEPQKPIHEALNLLPGTGTELRASVPEQPDKEKERPERSKDSRSPLPNFPPASLIAHIVSRLLHAIDSPSPALSASACRTAITIFEARAWCTSLSNGYLLQSKPMQAILMVLQKTLNGVLISNERSATERCYAAQALLWAQLGPEDHAAVTPSVLLRAASHGGLSVHSVVKALFVDPWPEALISQMLAVLLRRVRCTPGMAKSCLELASALAAAVPSRVTKDQMQVLWESAPGTTAVHSALALLSSPLPPITQPNITAPVEVKALAACEEAAYEGLRSFAAWWLGEHINGVCGVLAWKPPPKASVLMPFILKHQHNNQQQKPKQGQQQQGQQGEGTTPADPEGGNQGQHAGPGGDVASLDPLERMALAAAVHAPLLAAVLSHLQRALLTGHWELCVAASQALAKLAVRSPEPYRIQAYSALLTAVQMGGTSSGDGFDPLGLSGVAAPALEVLDAMYAGEIVLASHVSTYGTNHKDWPKPALASLQRRHDWLIAMIMQRVGLVPKDVFFPLGKASRELLRPDLPLEHVAEGDTEDADALDNAKEEGEGKKKDLKPDRDPLYEYYGDEKMEQREEEDLLAKWQPGGDDSKLARVNWGRLGEDDSDREMLLDEDDVRPGVMLYPFSAVEPGEVSAAAGERVRVTMDMGDWLHVITSTGAQGLVPASYARVEEAPDSSSMEGSTKSGGRSLGRRQEDHAYAAYDSYEPYDYSAQYNEGYASPRAGHKLEDEFGSELRAAAEAKSHRAQEAQQAAWRHRGSDSESSSLSGALRGQASDSETFHSAAYRGMEDDRESEPAVDKGPAPPAMGFGSLAKALYDFEAQEENEISIREDEELEVQGPEEDGWFPVMRLKDGQRGLVPATYIAQKPII